MGNSDTSALGANPSPYSGSMQPRPAPQEPVVQPPAAVAPPAPVSAPAMQAPDASQMPSFNAGTAQPAPAFHQDDTPNYNGADQSTPSNFTTSFAPEAITNPAVRQAFEPQIQQDLEQARYAGTAGYRDARLGMSQQELQLRQKAEADRVAAEQAKQQKAMQDASDLQRMKDAGIKTFKGPDGNEYPQTENGKAIYQPITEKDAEVGYFDDKGGYTDNAGNTFTGQPGAAVKVTRDRLGNLTPVDPDRNVQAQPWVDDQGKPWLVKQNQHNAWQYIDPNDALNDPKLQKPAAQALWQGDKAKNEVALSSAQKAVENSTALIDPDKLGINDKILNAPPKVQINALTPTLQSLQKTVDAGPPPDRGNAWFGLGADRGPDPDALAQYNDAKQGVTALQAHLQNLQDLRDASDQAKALKDGGPSLYLQRAQSEKKNSDDTDAAYAKAGLNPDQIAAAKQALQAALIAGQANDTYQDLGNAINAGQVAPPNSAQNNSGAVQSPSTAPGQSGQSQAAAPSPSLWKSFVDAYKQEGTNRDINVTPPEQMIDKLNKIIANPSSQPTSILGKGAQFAGSLAGQIPTIAKFAGVGGAAGAGVGLASGPGEVATIPTGIALGARAGFGVAAAQDQHAQTLIDTYARLKQQGMSDQDAYARAQTAANSAANIIVPFVANSAIPAFKGFGKGIAKIATGAATEAGFFGATGAGSQAVEQNAQQAAGVQFKPGEKTQNLIDAAEQNAFMGAAFHGIHAALGGVSHAIQNNKIATDLDKSGSNAKYVQQVAAAVTAAKTPEQATKVKDALLSQLSPQNKIAVEAHLNAVLDQRQKLADSDKQATASLPDLNPKLANIPDQQLAIYASGGAHPDDKSAPTPAEAVYEINARKARQDAIAANQPVRDAIIDVATRQSDKIKAAAKTPDGQALLDALNRTNAQRPAGTGAATLDTAQLASDLSPKTNPDSNIQPHAVGYLPLAHEIEQIKDPNDRAFAANAIKLLNGRHFDESKIDMHDQAKQDSAQKQAEKTAQEAGQPAPEPRHPNDFEARQTKDGNPALTEKGLTRLRQLVPESRKMLSGVSGEPITAQHLAEQGGKIDEKSQPKADKKVSKSAKDIRPNPNAQRVPHLAGIEDARLSQKLQGLRANRERLQIAMDAQKKKTGGVPEGLSRLAESHDRAIAEHEQEVETRKQQRQPPEAEKPQEAPIPSEKQASENDSKTVDAIQEGKIKTPSRNEPGTMVSYGHGGEKATGEVMAVSFEDHSITVRDPKTGENRNIPFSDIIHEPQEKAPEATETPAGKTTEAVGPQQAEPKREATAGGTTSVAEPFVVRYDEDGKAVHESSLLGLEGHEIPEDHLEAAKMLTQAYNKYQKVFAALGIKGFTKSSEKRGLGVSVGWENPELVQVNLAKLAEQLKIVGDKGRDARQRLDLAMDEELKHSATLRVAGDDGKGKYEADRAVDTLSKVWQSATKEQKDLVLDLYDKGATHLFAGGKAKDTYGAGLRDAEDTKEWNANRGAEYVRMALQAHADGKVTELESLIKNNTAWDMIKGVINYLREKLSPTDPTAQKLIADVNDLLRVKHDIDAGQKPEASTPEQKLKRAPRPKKPKVSKEGVSVPDYDKFKTAEYRKVAPPEDVPNAEHSLAPFNKYGERISGKPESILDQEPKDQYDKVVDPETGAIKWNLIKKASEAEKIDFAKRAAQSLGIETTARTYQGLVDAIHEEERNRRNVVREAIGAAPEDAAQARGWQAAHDYLDEQVRDPRNWKEGLMFGFHDIAFVFKSAIRAGSNAVDDLIHKLTAKQPEEGITVGKSRMETDERHNYIPTKDSPEGVENRRDMRSAAKGMSAALKYAESKRVNVVQNAIDLGAKLYQSVKSKAQWIASISDKLEPLLANLPGEERQNVKATLFDYVAHGGKDAAVFTQDSLDHMKAVEPSSNPARVKDGRIVRPKIGSETDRVSKLIKAARKGENGQSTFVFDDGKGNSARVYTKPDGTSTVRVPDATVAGTFKGVKEAVQHLVSKGFDLQSSKIERKLAQQEAIARITAMVSQGLKIGQRRFHFAHEDGRIAAMHALKDGSFSVTGYGERQTFQTAKAAANFLHDRGFEMQSSTLEKGLRDRGLHPDQLNEPVPYTDAQKKTIDTYRKAKGLEPLYAAAEEHPDAVHIGDMDFGKEKLPLFNLKRDIEGHPKHSTVSEETLRNAGINPDEIPRINTAPELPVNDEKRPDRREIPFEVKSDKEQAESYHNAISRLAAKGDPNPDKTVVDHVSGFLKSVLPTVLKHAKVNEVSTGIGGWFDGEKTQTTPNIVLSLDTNTPEGKQEASDLMRALTQTLHQSQGNVFERSGQINASHGALTLTLPKDFSDDQVKALMQELAGLKDSAQNSHLGGFTNFKDKNGNRMMTIGDQFYTPPKGSTFARELNKSLPELDKILKTYNITDRKFQPLKIETHDYEPEATSNQRSGDTGQARPDEVAGPEGGRLSLERGLKRGIGHALDSIHSSAEDSKGVGSPDAGGSEAERRAAKNFDNLGEAKAVSPKRFFAQFRESVGHEASIEGKNGTVLKWAEENGLIIPKEKVFGPFNDYENERPSLEHYVYFIPNRDRVLKVGSPAKHWGLDDSPVKYLQNLHDQDAITGDYMDYKVLGITRIGGFEPSPVITCRYIDGDTIPAGELHERLQDMGWEPVPGRNYTYRDPESRVTIIDAHNGNILKVSRDDKDPGYLMPIDIHIDGDVRKLTEAMKFKPESNSLHASSEAEPFYSHMQKVLEAKMPQRASAEQIRGILKGGQVKEDEMKWSGIDDYLKDNPTATKADLLNYLKTEGGVKIQTHTFGRNVAGHDPDELGNKAREMAKADGKIWNDLSVSERVSYTDRADKSYGFSEKYGQASLNLPGGSNYRERVYSLPRLEQKQKTPAEKEDYYNRMQENQRAINEMLYDATRKQPPGGHGYRETAARNALKDDPKWIELMRQKSALIAEGSKPRLDAENANYTSSHFPDIPNYLAHSRMDDRVDSEGKPGLFVQEFQSDRHQQGRDSGYLEKDQLMAEYTTEFNPNTKQHEVFVKGHRDDVGVVARYSNVRQALDDVYRRNTENTGKKIPDAPFRQTKQWAGFLFRRALAEAIQGEKKWIGWTTGDTQAERYDLSKQVNAISWSKSSKTENREVVIEPSGEHNDIMVDVSPDGKIVRGEYAGKGLDEVIGKDMAQKIMAEDHGNLSGAGLKVGGEGMRKFYDQILPSYVKEYAKKWGVKPELSEIAHGKIPTDDEVIARGRQLARADGQTAPFDELNDNAQEQYLDEAQSELEVKSGASKIWKLPITDEMRDSIKQHGQPLFAAAEDSAQNAEHRALQYGKDSTAVHASPEAKSLSKEALGFKERVSSKIPEDVKAVGGLIHEVKESILKTWAPQSRSEEAAFTGRSLSAAMAKYDNIMNQAQLGLAKAHEFLDRQTPEFNLSVIDAIEQNKTHPDPQADEIAQLFRQTNNRFRDMVRHMPNSHFQAFIENYFPHIFAKDDVARYQKFIKSKIEGSTSFLKHRTIPTVAEAVDMGFKLASDNPADLFLTRWSQMSKYMAGQEMLNDLRKAGIAQDFKKESEIPLGNRQVDDRLGLSTVDQKAPDGTVTRIQRHLYAPDTVVDLLDNHLSPGLRDGALYKVISGLANTMNSAQLGFSAFHLGFTSLDMAVSKMAYGLEQLHNQNYAEGAKAILTAPQQILSPITLAKGAIGKNLNFLTAGILKDHLEWDTHIGSRLSSELDAPGSQDEAIQAIARSVIQGGGANRMDEFYSNQMVKSFLKNWRQGNRLAAAYRAPLAAVELVAKPIMEYIVPRQKLAVFADLARMEMQKLGPDAGTDQVRKAMQKAWASVDNRMGQLRYDNLFWDKTAKDAAMLAVRSVGWNLGSYREILGGLGDAAAYGKNRLTGKQAEFTHRMAYVLGLHMLVGSIGAFINYLYTGQAPQDSKDVFFPRTGQKSGDGHNIRLALPSYIKDEAAFAHDPAGTLVNKANPVFSMLGQLWRNQDYYGTEIRHQGDNPFLQAGQLLGFGAKQLEPFAFSGQQQLQKQGASLGTSVLPEIGVVPAAKWIDKSPAEEKADEILNNKSKETRTAAQFQAAQARSQVFQQLEANDPTKGGSSAKFGQILRNAVEQNIIPRSEINETIKKIRMTPLERQFNSMDYDDAIQVWQAATREEKAKLLPMMQRKVANAREKGQKINNSILKLSN